MLGPLTEEEVFIPDSHWHTKVGDAVRFEFHSGGSGTEFIVEFMWGLSGIDRSGTNRWTSSDIGSAVYDDDFNLATQAN